MRMVKSQERRVESQNSVVALRLNSVPRPSPLAPRPARGFTLIELLVVITIIGILAALVVGVATVAGETSREQHTKHVVERMHTLLMEYYGTYKTRRVRLNPTLEKDIANTKFSNSNDATVRGRVLAEARLYALREMMLMEVPDRWSDVLLNDVGPASGPPSSVPGAPLYLAGRTDLSNVYLRRYLSLVGRTNALTGLPNTAEELKRNQGAECLYMIITLATGDGEARTLLGASSIGDSDGDGAPEFLDGWNHPINFLRWAPGFDSQIELDQNVLDDLIKKGKAAEARAEVAKDHDPFDLFRADDHAFRLVPLIYSPGRDEDSGLYAAPDLVVWPLASSVTVNKTQAFLKPFLSPYELSSQQKGYLGTEISLVDPTQPITSTDNVHNHLLGKR